MALARATPLTLKLIRQTIGKREITIGATGATSTATAIQDDSIKDSGESPDAYDRAWVRCSGETRRIAIKGYAPITGTITLSRALSSIPTTGTEYEIHRALSPDKIDQAINDALVSLSYVRETVITVVNNQTEYSLDAYDWLWDRSQIVDVLLRLGATASEYRYTPLTWWRFQRKSAAEGTVSSMPYTGNYLQTKPRSDTDCALILRTLCPYQVLDTDTKATGCPFDWLMAAAEWHMYDLLAGDDAPAADRKAMAERRERAGVELVRLNKKYMERPKMTVMLPDTAHGWETNG